MILIEDKTWSKWSPLQSLSRAGWLFASKTAPPRSFARQSLFQHRHHSEENRQNGIVVKRGLKILQYSHSQRGRVCLPHDSEIGQDQTRCPNTCWWSCPSWPRWRWSWRRSRRTCSSAWRWAGRGRRSSRRWACLRGSCPGSCSSIRGCSSSTGCWQPRYLILSSYFLIRRFERF